MTDKKDDKDAPANGANGGDSANGDANGAHQDPANGNGHEDDEHEVTWHQERVNGLHHYARANSHNHNNGNGKRDRRLQMPPAPFMRKFMQEFEEDRRAIYIIRSKSRDSLEQIASYLIGFGFEVQHMKVIPMVNGSVEIYLCMVDVAIGQDPVAS